nr:uncharacterized protein LOC117860931 [Setaria viridis]
MSFTMAAAKGKRVYLTWTDEMDNALLAVLVEHHNNGDHAQNGWKPHVYNAAIKNVRDRCNVEITKDNIIARCKTFDKHYEIISKILSQSGFGWDWEIIICQLIVKMRGIDMWRQGISLLQDQSSEELGCTQHYLLI